MNIVVCIKQVPASSDVKIDPVTGVLIRDGNNTKRRNNHKGKRTFGCALLQAF